MNAGFGVGISLDADGFAGALAGSGIGGSPLSANGQTPHVPDAAVTLDILQPFQVHADFPAQITFNDVFPFLNGMNDLGELLFVQIFRPNSRFNIGFFEDGLGVGGPDPIDVTKRDLDPLLARYFHSDDACHSNSSRLTLPLFVAAVGADHPDHPFAADDLAMFAKSFYGCAHFHNPNHSIVFHLNSSL
jgi:hypothetical protein